MAEVCGSRCDSDLARSGCVGAAVGAYTQQPERFQGASSVGWQPAGGLFGVGAQRKHDFHCGAETLAKTAGGGFLLGMEPGKPFCCRQRPVCGALLALCRPPSPPLDRPCCMDSRRGRSDRIRLPAVFCPKIVVPVLAIVAEALLGWAAGALDCADHRSKIAFGDCHGEPGCFQQRQPRGGRGQGYLAHQAAPVIELDDERRARQGSGIFVLYSRRRHFGAPRSSGGRGWHPPPASKHCDPPHHPGTNPTFHGLSCKKTPSRRYEKVSMT